MIFRKKDKKWNNFLSLKREIKNKQNFILKKKDIIK